jgi:type II secretory pathway component HofQ
MPPPALKQSDPGPSTAQIELTKAMIAATAQITASMVAVTQEKNPAKISEAFRVVYKTIQEVVKGTAPKPTSASASSDSKNQ